MGNIPVAMSMQRNEGFEQQLTGVLDRQYGAALHMTKNRTDAEDLVTETVTRALQHRDSPGDPASFQAHGILLTTRKPAGRDRLRAGMNKF